MSVTELQVICVHDLNLPEKQGNNEHLNLS